MIQTIPSGTRNVEVGWYQDPIQGGGGFYICLPHTTGPPKFLAYIESNLGIKCMTNNVPTMGQSGSPYEINVADVNDDGIWRYKLDGVNEWDSTIQASLPDNVSRSNGERASASDTAYSFFNGLDRMTENGTWVPWQNAGIGGGDDDPDFHNCLIDNDAVRVIRDSETCPP